MALNDFPKLYEITFLDDGLQNIPITMASWIDRSYGT